MLLLEGEEGGDGEAGGEDGDSINSIVMVGIALRKKFVIHNSLVVEEHNHHCLDLRALLE
ncbi:hypothetical protein PGB90_000960 [Kerria lacca]